MTRDTHRFNLPRRHVGIWLAACTVTLTGCGTIHSARMWFPKASGMDEVDSQLYVEPVLSAEQRHGLIRQIAIGRAEVAAFYGGITTAPYFVACLTAACDHRFGAYSGQRAAAYGDLAIRLSAKGQSARLIAHEWSHAELYRRVGGWWFARRIPRWFDEGVAVVVADEPLHSEANWSDIQRQGLPVPNVGALVSFSDWGNALQAYGETAGDVPGNLRVVYTAAGHAVRAFLACAGPTGLASLLAAVRSGSSFDDAYTKASANCVR